MLPPIFDFKVNCMRFILLVLCGLNYFLGFGQAFTSYYTGDTIDVVSSPTSGTVLMGGASENDYAMRWFLERADGGDVLVLRASGEDGYNDYFYSELGISVNSVQTIVCNSAAASFDPYLIAQIENAEALWFAGGDQWDYISFWRDTPVEDAINFVVNEKKIPIGGTSAGSAIMGEAYFSAENGSATSAQSLYDPFNDYMTLGYDDFIQNPVTMDLITDTHYDNPDRRGRHVAFLARLFNDYGHPFYGIGCEEYTAVCIDENNIAHAYGSYPGEEDYVYFIQVNCFEPQEPELCVDGEKLTWNRNDVALKVIKMGADNFGSGTLDLNDWKTAAGDDFTWENWWVEDGILNVLSDASAIDCTVANEDLIPDHQFIKIYPNPVSEKLTIEIKDNSEIIFYQLINMNGKIVKSGDLRGNITAIDIEKFPPSIYTLKIFNSKNYFVYNVMVY